MRKHNFSLRIVKYWNSLPNHVINAKDVYNFEVNLDKFWKDQPLMFEDFKTDIIIKSKERNY